MKGTPHHPEFRVGLRNMMVVGFIFFCLLFSCQDSFGQKKGRSNKVSFDATSTDPGSPPQPAETNKSSKSTQKQKSTSQKKSSPRSASTQQATRFTPLDRNYDYSKPPYFGHKRPVVIRPIGKQKLCRVCGIKH